MDIPSLVPTFPNTFDAWEGLVTILVIGILKLTRARFLKHRSEYIDRFGWSIISWDIVFGVSAMVVLFMTLYPGILPSVWIVRSMNAGIILIGFWQLAEIVTAPDHRIKSAMSGVKPVEYGGDPYDRRKKLRRTDDEQAYEAWRKAEGN